MANTLAVVRTDVGFREGDSTDDPNFPYQVLNGFFEAFESHYRALGPTGNPPVFTCPRCIRKAVNGSTTTTIEARLSAELAVNPGATLGAMAAGINDVHTGVDIPTIVIPKVTSIMAKFVAASIRRGIWVGPFAWGEDGAFRTGIVAFDVAVAPIVQAAGWTYVSLIAIFDSIEAQFNPSHLVVGPATTPDATGTHFNEWGSAQIVQYVINYLITNGILSFA